MMSIRKLKNSDAEKLEQFLSDYAETSMFLRSNMKRVGLEYQNSDYHGDYFGAFDENGDVIGVLAHYWNGNIMMQALDKAILGGLIHAFRDATTRPIAGILGADEQAKAVIDELLLADKAYATNRSEGLYTLDLDKLSVPEKFDFSESEMIDAGKVDRSILTRWIKAYEIEALGSEDNDALDGHVESRVNRTINGTDCWALLIDGEPVSLSGFNARLPDIVQIGPVWTPPEYRSRGYARVLVAMTLQKAKADGADQAILFTDNPAAAKAYEAIGFKETGLYRLALLKKPVDLKERLEL